MARVQVASLRWLYGPSQVERSFDWLGVLFALSRGVLPPQLVVLAFLVGRGVWWWFCGNVVPVCMMAAPPTLLLLYYMCKLIFEERLRRVRDQESSCD